MAISMTLNEQQQQVQDTAHEFFARHSPLSLARQYDNADAPFPRELWLRMAELGWLGMCFPAEYDGLDCDLLDMFGLYVEMGRYLVPSPHLETVGLAGSLIADQGSASQKARLLPSIARGEAIVSCAIMEPDGVFGPKGVSLAAAPRGDGYVLSGAKVLVPYANAADWLVVAARTVAAPGDAAGVTLFLIDAHASGVVIERTPNIGGFPLCAVTFADVTVGPADILGQAGQGWKPLDAAMMRAAVLQSAMVIGAGEAVLEMTADYVKNRVQFGEPIGKHQAVQYLVTNVAMHSYNTRVLTLQAGWRIDSGRSFLREAALAKAAASKAAFEMTFSAHEAHAGIGFMNDYDLQLYTRRCKHWEYHLGDARYHLERAVEENAGRPSMFGVD